MKDVATRLLDIGNRRAILNGVKDPSKNYGIPIKYTIPWSKVPQELQNKLDPTATIIPTTKRRRKRVQAGKRVDKQAGKRVDKRVDKQAGKRVDKQAGTRVTEPTWNKLNRYRGS